jgi:hypothetical protein
MLCFDIMRNIMKCVDIHHYNCYQNKALLRDIIICIDHKLLSPYNLAVLKLRYMCNIENQLRQNVNSKLMITVITSIYLHTTWYPFFILCPPLQSIFFYLYKKWIIYFCTIIFVTAFIVMLCVSKQHIADTN